MTVARLQIALVAALCGAASCGHTSETTVRVASTDLRVVTLTGHFNNAHLVIAEDGAFLVDAGAEDDAEQLDKQIRKAGVDPAELRAIILTHGHADHAGGAGWFRSKYGTKIVATRVEQGMLAAGRNTYGLCPTDGTAVRRLEKTKAASYASLVADTWLDGPTPLQPIAGVDGTIIPVAGHTKGSLVIAMGDVAFVGDLLRGEILAPATAAVHFYMCDLEDNRQDIQGLLDEQPAAHRFYTGHFGPVDRVSVQALVHDWPMERRSVADP